MNWEIKNTGKGFYLIIFTLFSIFGVISMILYGSRRDPDRNIEDLALTFLFFTPLLIGWILVFSKFIFKKRIPIRITINNGNFEFHFSDNKHYLPNIGEFSFAFHEYKRYNVLVINKIIKSKRGHLINKELMSIVGLAYGIGWKKEMIEEITKYLKKSGIDYFNLKDKTFLLRIIQ